MPPRRHTPARRHIGSGADDPPEPGHRAVHQQHVSDFVLRRAAAIARPTLHSRQTARRPDGHRRRYLKQRRGPGIHGRCPCRAKPEPSLVYDEAFIIIASLRNVSWNLAIWPKTPPPVARPPFHLMPRASFLPLMG